MRDERLSDLKQALQLDENSVVLCFNTEGDTDKEIIVVSFGTELTAGNSGRLNNKIWFWKLALEGASFIMS